MCRTKEKRFIPSGIDVRNCGKGIAAQSISTLPPCTYILQHFQQLFNRIYLVKQIEFYAPSFQSGYTKSFIEQLSPSEISHSVSLLAALWMLLLVYIVPSGIPHTSASSLYVFIPRCFISSASFFSSILIRIVNFCIGYALSDCLTAYGAS